MKKTNETAAPAVITPGAPGASNDAGGQTRKRKYSPRVRKKQSDPMVIQKTAELRDAKILGRLIQEAALLTPWGLGQLQEGIKKIGPVQPSLFNVAGAGAPAQEPPKGESEEQQNDPIPTRPKVPSRSATTTTHLLNAQG